MPTPTPEILREPQSPLAGLVFSRPPGIQVHPGEPELEGQELQDAIDREAGRYVPGPLERMLPPWLRGQPTEPGRYGALAELGRMAGYMLPAAGLALGSIRGVRAANTAAAARAARPITQADIAEEQLRNLLGYATGQIPEDLQRMMAIPENQARAVNAIHPSGESIPPGWGPGERLTADPGYFEQRLAEIRSAHPERFPAEPAPTRDTAGIRRLLGMRGSPGLNEMFAQRANERIIQAVTPEVQALGGATPEGQNLLSNLLGRFPTDSETAKFGTMFENAQRGGVNVGPQTMEQIGSARNRRLYRLLTHSDYGAEDPLLREASEWERAVEQHASVRVTDPRSARRGQVGEILGQAEDETFGYRTVVRFPDGGQELVRPRGVELTGRGYGPEAASELEGAPTRGTPAAGQASRGLIPEAGPGRVTSALHDLRFMASRMNINDRVASRDYNGLVEMVRQTVDRMGTDPSVPAIARRALTEARISHGNNADAVAAIDQALRLVDRANRTITLHAPGQPYHGERVRVVGPASSGTVYPDPWPAPGVPMEPTHLRVTLPDPATGMEREFVVPREAVESGPAPWYTGQNAEVLQRENQAWRDQHAPSPIRRAPGGDPGHPFDPEAQAQGITPGEATRRRLAEGLMEPTVTEGPRTEQGVPARPPAVGRPPASTVPTPGTEVFYAKASIYDLEPARYVGPDPANPRNVLIEQGGQQESVPGHRVSYRGRTMVELRR